MKAKGRSGVPCEGKRAKLGLFAASELRGRAIPPEKSTRKSVDRPIDDTDRRRADVGVGFCFPDSLDCLFQLRHRGCHERKFIIQSSARDYRNR